MEDIYEYTNRDSTKPQVKYAFFSNERSDNMTNAIIDFMRKTYVGLENLTRENLRNTVVTELDEDADIVLHRLFRGSISHFWDSVLSRAANMQSETKKAA